jgi:acyl carrier protein
MPTTFDRLCLILSRDYTIAPDRLTFDAPLEELGIDSLGTVELLWTIEDDFKIKLPSEPVPLMTLGDVVHFVDELVKVQIGTAPLGRAAMPSAVRAT